MHSLSRSIIRNFGRVGSAPPRWWPVALAPRDVPPMKSVREYPNQHFCRLFFEKKQIKLYWQRFCFSFDTIQGMDKAERKKTVKGSNPIMIDATDDIFYIPVIPGSSHRDGTIYKRRLDWQRDYDVDIADRTETRLEAACEDYMTCDMMQIFSLNLAKSPINSGSLELYGYVAARDGFDLKLNYLFNRNRDDTIIVQQGSIIEMTGPKRGIAFCCDVLLEFDIRIKNGEKEEDDMQLIDGVSEFEGLFMLWEKTKFRIGGNCGAIDMSFALVNDAVSATVEVIISEVQNGFDLSLSSIISVVKAHEEFQLFRGTVYESCGLRKFVIAVTVDTVMHLKFMVGHKGSNGNTERICPFKATLNGYASHKIKLEQASIAVKVTWAAWPPL